MYSQIKDGTDGLTRCKTAVEEAIDCLTSQINADCLGDFNEATLQHHLAMALHLGAKDSEDDFHIILERRVPIGKGGLARPDKEISDIDIYFEIGRQKVRCAIEMKLFKKENQREPNNRYDAYADIKALEAYLAYDLCDIGFFLLFTDHKHYYDNHFGKMSPNTADFSLRDGHIYESGRTLYYKTNKPHGPPLSLSSDYSFDWSNVGHRWRRLVLEVGQSGQEE